MTQQAAPNPQMFAGIDFSQYPTWQKIVTPRGTVLYVVPGTGWVYDPFLSAAKGRPVLSPNPQPEIDDRNRQIDSQSIQGQLIPVVGGSVGTIGGAVVADRFFNQGRLTSTSDLPTQNPQPTPQQPVTGNVQPVSTPQPTTTAPTAPSQGFVQGAQTGSVPTIQTGNTVPEGAAIPEGYTAIGSSADGGTMIAPTNQVNKLPPEVVNDTGFMQTVDWAKVAQGAVGVMQLYDAYKAWRDGDKGQAVAQGVQGGVNVAAAAGSQTAQSAAPYLSGGVEVYKGAAAQFDKNMSEEDKAYAAAMTPARAAAAYYTLGLSSLAEGFAYGQWGGTMKKMDKLNQSFLSPIGGVYRTLRAVGSSKSGAQVLRDKVRDGMQQEGVLDDKYQGTLADGSTYDFGKDGSSVKWKELNKIAEQNRNAWNASVPLTDTLSFTFGLNGQQMSDVSGWLSKAAVSNANDDPEIAKANVRHIAQKRGLTYDAVKQMLDQAKENKQIDEAQYNYYLANARDLTAGAPAQPPQAQNRIGVPATSGSPAAPTASLPARSQTLSPGINLQGQRINYADMGKQLADRFNRRRR